MNKSRLMLTSLAAFVLTMAFASAALASVPRTFVSSTGLDSNTSAFCSRTQPCRNFAAAYSVTSAKGEIVALDSAGYGQLTITQAITIAGNDGAFVTVAAATTGITVNAGSTDLVILKDIFITGAGNPSGVGVTLTSGQLVIRHCSFTRLAAGLSVTGAKADVIDSDFHGNGTAIQADGSGNDQSGNGNFVGTTEVRLNGGNITFNAIGLQQNNAGLTAPAQPRQNIWVFTFGNSGSVNMAGNTTAWACVGTDCTGAPGSYNMGSKLL